MESLEEEESRRVAVGAERECIKLNWKKTKGIHEEQNNNDDYANKFGSIKEVGGEKGKGGRREALDI